MMNAVGKVAGVLVLAAVGMLGACEKETPTIAKVRVIDVDGNPCPNAAVHLYPTPTVSPHGQVVVDDILYTDADGYVIFDYSDHYNLGQAGFAVLNIEATTEDNLLSGEGIIKVEPERINQETVVIQP
jgi:hypothetical protein